MIRIGIALFLIGGVTKLSIKTYRKIKNKEFFQPSTSARSFYKGGFASKMTRREAQLILNIREGVPMEKIRDNHRKMMLINHPDNNGSTYLATKINEAKELLSKS